MPFVSYADGNVIYTTSSDGSLGSNFAGNVSDIFSLKNPKDPASSTSTKSYVVSGIAQPDSTISLYAYNSATDRYDRMYTEAGVLMQTKVGASGLFAQSVNLNTGKNSIMIVATKGNNTQVVKFEITLNQSLFSKIINFGTDLSQIFVR
jgi:uncharacterized protein YfaP (DUF2135 family)